MEKHETAESCNGELHNLYLHQSKAEKKGGTCSMQR